MELTEQVPRPDNTNTGFLPTIYRRIVCCLWRGHRYRVVGVVFKQVVRRCDYCGKEKVY